MTTDGLTTVTLVAIGGYLTAKSVDFRRTATEQIRAIEGAVVFADVAVVELLFMAVASVSLLCSLFLLSYSYLVHSMWLSPPALIWCCIAAVALSLALYVAVGMSTLKHNLITRWAAYVWIAFGMLLSLVPVGFGIGFGVALTGVWDDAVGSHSDSDVDGVILFTLLGLLCGPAASYWSIRAASRRFNGP